MSAVFEVGGHVPSAPGGFVFTNTAVGGGGSGFLPAGHFINAKQAMIQVFPRPDTESNTWARHRWAYFDGVTPVQYKIPIGVSFGAFPYVYSLDSASIALGMSIPTTGWNTAWVTDSSTTAFQKAAAAGYGYLVWTPTGSVSNHTVSITVTDQQLNTLTITFTVSTSSSTSQFIFVDAVNGNDSTGTGTISAPWQSFTKATTGNANKLLYLRAGNYTVVSNGTVGGDQNVRFYTLNTTSQPSALMAFPGDTVPVISMAASAIVSTNAPDLFWQGLNPNGYDTSAFNVKMYWQQNTGTAGARQTFDSITWTNSGVTSGGGASPGDDIAGAAFYFDGFDQTGNLSNYTPYQFINNYTESNRANSGRSGNNYVGCTCYSTINTLVQGMTFVQAGYSMDQFGYFKVNVVNGCFRGCTVNVGSGTYAYGCSYGQPLSGSMTTCESCYNTMVGSGFGLSLGQTSGVTYGSLWAYRNSIVGTGGGFGGGICTGATAATLLEFDNNAAQGGTTPSASFIVTSGNIVQSSGLLDTTLGLLTSGFSADLGLVGAQIA